MIFKRKKQTLILQWLKKQKYLRKTFFHKSKYASKNAKNYKHFLAKRTNDQVFKAEARVPTKNKFHATKIPFT